MRNLSVGFTSSATGQQIIIFFARHVDFPPLLIVSLIDANRSVRNYKVVLGILLQLSVRKRARAGTICQFGTLNNSYKEDLYFIFARNASIR